MKRSKTEDSASLMLGLQSKYIRDAISYSSRSDGNQISDELRHRLQRSSKSNSKLDKRFGEEFPHHVTELTPPFGKNNEEFNDFLREASLNHRNYISDGKYDESSDKLYEIKQFGDRLNEYKSTGDSHSKKWNVITSEKFNRTMNSFTQDKMSTTQKSMKHSQKHVLKKTGLDQQDEDNFEKNVTDVVSLGNANPMSRSNRYPKLNYNPTGSSTTKGNSAVWERFNSNTSTTNYKLENFRPPITVNENTRKEKLKTNSLKLNQTSIKFIGKVENASIGENTFSKEKLKETTKSLIPKTYELNKTRKHKVHSANNADTSSGLTTDPQITTYHPPIIRTMNFGDYSNLTATKSVISNALGVTDFTKTTSHTEEEPSFVPSLLHSSNNVHYSGWKEVKTTPAIENTKSISNQTFNDEIGDLGDNLNQKFKTEPVIQNDLKMPLAHYVHEESPGFAIPNMNKLNSKQYVEAFEKSAKVEQLQESENNDHSKQDYNPSSKNEALQPEIHLSPNDIFYDEKQAFGEPRQNDWINGYQNQNEIYHYDYLSNNILSSSHLIQNVSPNSQNKAPYVNSMVKILRKKQYRTQQFLTKGKSIIKTAAVLLLPFSALALFTG